MRRTLAHFGLVLGSILAGVVLAGCNYQYAISATNDTDQRFLIRTPWPNDPEHIGVIVLEPHGSNVALAWNGNPEIAAELLDPSCDTRGEFTSIDGETYSVAGVPGVTLTLIRGLSLTDFRNNGEVYKVTDCGGYVEM